jgi:hypothetical protein
MQMAIAFPWVESTSTRLNFSSMDYETLCAAPNCKFDDLADGNVFGPRFIVPRPVAEGHEIVSGLRLLFDFLNLDAGRLVLRQQFSELLTGDLNNFFEVLGHEGNAASKYRLCKLPT